MRRKKKNNNENMQWNKYRVDMLINTLRIRMHDDDDDGVCSLVRLPYPIDVSQSATCRSTTFFLTYFVQTCSYYTNLHARHTQFYVVTLQLLRGSYSTTAKSTRKININGLPTLQTSWIYKQKVIWWTNNFRYAIRLYVNTRYQLQLLNILFFFLPVLQTDK